MTLSFLDAIYHIAKKFGAWIWCFTINQSVKVLSANNSDLLCKAANSPLLLGQSKTLRIIYLLNTKDVCG